MKAKMEYNTVPPAVIGVDIGKEVFHLVGLGADGKIAFRRKIRRLGLKDAFEKLPTCIVSMEACLSAHFVSRTLRALGHEPRIIPAIYVKPLLKGQKNDYNDAEPHASIGYRAPAPEVFVPALAAWPAAQSRPAPPAMLPLALRPTLN